MLLQFGIKELQPRTIYYTYDELVRLSKPSMDCLYLLVKREIEEKDPKLLVVGRLTFIYGLVFSNRFFARHEQETEDALKKLIPAPDPEEDDDSNRPPKKKVKRESRSRSRARPVVEPPPPSSPEPQKKKKSKKRSASPQPETSNKRSRAKSRSKSKARGPSPEAKSDVSSCSRLASHTLRPLSRRERLPRLTALCLFLPTVEFLK